MNREERDLYNASKELVGKTFFKGDIIPDGYFYIIVAIVLEDMEGNFIIQKRTIRKGGKWAFTAGHPKSGESSADGIKSEVREEIGLNIDNEEPLLFNSYVKGNKFFDLYYLKKDIELKDLQRQESEVDDIKIVSKEEIINLHKQGEFRDDHFNIFKKFLSWKED